MVGLDADSVQKTSVRTYDCRTSYGEFVGEAVLADAGVWRAGCKYAAYAVGILGLGLERR
jgi:hypothetical protein